jgi:hypothetical protein
MRVTRVSHTCLREVNMCSSGGHFMKYWEACGHAPPRKIFKIWTMEMVLQHSENTFCKKLGFQNTVLNNGIKLRRE